MSGLEQMWHHIIQPIQGHMHHENYGEALHQIDGALLHFGSIPLFKGQLLLHSAECRFQLGHLKVCLEHLVLGHQLVTPHPEEKKRSFSKWIQRSEQYLDTQYGEQFARFCLRFLSRTPREKAQCNILMGILDVSRIQLLQQAFALDKSIYEQYQSRWKRAGISAMQRKEYPEAKKLLQRVLTLSIDGSHRETRRSTLSHLARAHFYLKEYSNALRAGLQLHSEAEPDQEEAKRWKERGSTLFQDGNYQLSLEFYTLAIRFTPCHTNQDEFSAKLFSNRSIAFMKLGRFKEALDDANMSVQMDPNWSKGHYRQGTSLIGLKRFHEGCKAFCKAFHFAAESEKLSVLLQIIDAAMQTHSGLQDIPLTVPKPMVQDLIKRFVERKEWEKLYFLFNGGGGTVQKYQHGEGGLATGCDASCVPLEQVVEATLKNANVAKFVEVLIRSGASPKGSQGCQESPLRIATRKRDQQLIEVLSKYDQSHAKLCFKKGVNAFQEKRYREAINLLSTAMKGDLKSEQFIQACYYLSDSYYEQKDYQRGIEYGWRALNRESRQDKDLADKWKTRGNELNSLPTKRYDLMSDCYTLAMMYAPKECIDMRAAIYSNRSMAYVNQKRMNEAKEDARECIKLRRTWFRGYSRLGACFIAEKKYQEAILEYCRGVQAVQADNEKTNLMKDVLSACLKVEGEEVIQLPMKITTKVMNEFVRQVNRDGDVNKLRRIYLERKYKLPDLVEYQCLGNFANCATEIPLDMIMQSTIPEKDQLIEKLLEHGAIPSEYVVRKAVCDCKYKLAVIFLRHGIDPNCLQEFKGSRETFDQRAPHLGQWLNLGRKAMKNKSDHRAKLFYSLALEYPEALQDKKAQHEAYNALSEICFKQNSYDSCIELGRQCFKVSPVKSEAEAVKWQRRARMVSDDSFVPEYLTLAMNYAPPGNAMLRYELLCKRSDSFRKQKMYQQAIDDGKSATNIRPKHIEGYECLVACYRERNLPSKTFSALVHCLKVEQIDSYKWDHYLKEALDIAVNLTEGTSNLNIEVSLTSLKAIHDRAAESANWELIRLLYLGGGGPHKYEIRKGGLCTGFNLAENVSIEDVVSASFSYKPETIAALLDNGANVDGLRGNANPLVTSASKKEHEVMQVLLNHGANPCVKQDGSMPLVYKEVKKAIEKAIDTGGLKVVKVLLSSAHPDLENVQDSNGNSLFHLVMQGRKTNEKCKVLRALIDAKINPSIPNKQGKRPVDLCSKRDDRTKMLKKFEHDFTPKLANQTKPSNTKQQNNVKEKLPPTKDTWEDLEDKESNVKLPDKDEIPVAEMKKPISVPKVNIDKQRKEEDKKYKPISEPKVNIDKQKKEEDKKYILYLIERLDDAQISVIVQEQKPEEYQGDDSEDLTQVFEEDQEITLEDEADEDQKEDNSDLTEGASQTDLVSSFENLTWEVDCTENVWKTLRSKKVSERTRQQIIQKICMLAEGRWSTKQLCKRLEGESKERNIHLYETRITKGARIIWEKTIAFSARCSNDPKLRLSMGNQGLIYSDIIRVWDIVLNHKDLEHKIHNVVKSHQRGSHCIIKAELKGMKKEASEMSNQLALPSYYQERHERNPNTEEQSPVFFPPASSEDNEYHILKFYSVTSALINTLLNNDKKSKIDFPFKVTELEHAIINLRQEKPCAIILLGRSGTGKTTCCLYRLWTEFQTYWENAITAGPHIPKCVPADCIGQSDGDIVEEGAGSMTCSASQTTPTVEEVPCKNKPSTPNDVREDDSSDAREHGTNEERLSIQYEHLHQMFITKNTVLCSEVQKNFKELKNACPATKDLTMADDSLPNYITDIHEESWPLFIGARDWLLLLDASLPGEPFFPRGKDGSLLGKIEGWGQDDTHLHFIPDEDDDYDEDEENVEQDRPVAEKTEHQNTKSKKATNNKREVTYQVFVNELWPRMKKEVKNDFHPTLVWTEIRSFIKGSAEALKTKDGYLSCEEYEELGRKRAPAFVGDRPTVHKLFETYRCIIRSSRKMFDEADLVYNLYKRLMDHQEREWSIHYIYVDETQDFTQAELLLLIMCCRFPDRMFFTGDTAQSIMRGVAFRFEDLKSLFHAIKMSTKQNQPVRVPDRLYQLTHNYRSHAGILGLASSVVNLLQDLFPESFDKLDKDCGLFEGPKPVLLESCSLTDLAMILRGSKRQGSRIEFGAHQAVLVVSEEARDNMPDELKHGLVLTIYEAKGLEFDDVLIYNFFKDSHARKEWRVVTDYIIKASSQTNSGVTGLVEIQEEELKARPLKFDYEKHKVLNSELKFLYTAITRARVNVWFFDEDEENRIPVFEYFQRLHLVRAIKLDEQESSSTLSSMFAESSTAAEWRDQGQYFYSKNLWDVAEKCFSFGEDEMMVRRCQAHKQAQQALQNRSDRKKMKEMFCTAAKQFLDCGMPIEAEVCLHNARERELLAHLYKKVNKFEEASKLFRAEKCYDEASQCMEQMNNYDQAVEIFCKANHYSKAIEVLERFNSLNVKNPSESQGIVPPKPYRTIERLCYKLAETYFDDDKRKEMEDTLQRLPTDNRISFLKKHNCVEEAARALVDDDKKEEAARYLQLHGRFKEAMKYSEDSKFLGDCSLFEAQSCIKAEKDTGITEKLLEDAVIFYTRCKDTSGEGQAKFLLGVLRDDINTIKDAGKLFDADHNVCGEIEVMEELLKRDVKQFNFRIHVRAIERTLELLLNLHKPHTQLKADKQHVISKCEEFFGLSKIPDQTLRQYCTKTNERYQEISKTGSDHQVIIKEEENVDVKQAYKVIADHLFERVAAMVHKTTHLFVSKLDQIEQHSSAEISTLKDRFEVVFNWAYLDGVTSRFHDDIEKLNLQLPLERLTTNESKAFKSCQHLIQMLFPPTGSHSNFLSEQVFKIRRHSSVSRILNSYADHLCKKLDDTGLSTDTFLDISRVRQITDRTKRTMEFLQQKEKSFEAALSKEPESGMWKLMQKNGMVWKTKDQVSYECLLRFWESGKNHLVNGDVIQSVHDTCRRFLTCTAKFRFLKLPSIENTVMILENQLTVLLAMFTRLNFEQRGTFAYLPLSYLHRLRYSDDLNCTRRQHKWTYLAIDECVGSLTNRRQVSKCHTDVFSLLAYIVKLMFGVCTQYFNVFLDTFCTNVLTDQLIASGVAERVMVLTLTMLANCEMAISSDCQAIILQNVFSVIPPEALPQHMKEVFDRLDDAKNMGDVVGILKALLSERKENLFEVRWKGSHGMDTRIADPANNTLMFDVSVTEIKERITQKYGVDSQRLVPSKQDDMEIEEVQDALEMEEHVPETVPAHDMEKEERDQKENKAALVILRFFRNFIRNKKRALEKEELPSNVDRLSSNFKLDSSGCTICGVTFNKTSEEKASNLEDHRMSEPHKQTAQAFEAYKEFYNEKIQHVFDLKKSLQEHIHENLDLDVDMQMLDDMEKKVWDIVQETEKERTWSKNLRGLKNLVQKFETKIQTTWGLAQVDEDNGDEEEYYSCEDDDNETRLLPVVEKPKGKGKKGKRSRKNKK